MNPIAQELEAIHERAMDSEKERRNEILNQRSRNDIEDLIAVHCKTATDVQKALGPGYSSRDKVNTIIEEVCGKTGIPMKEKANRNKLIPLELFHAILKHENIPTWSDKYGHFCHVIPVANLKGGTGKSTTTLSLASQFALTFQARMRVLLLDLDPQGTNSLGAFGADTESSTQLTPTDFMLSEIEDGIVAEYLAEGYEIPDLINASILETHLPNLHVMTSFPRDERFYRMAKGDPDRIYSLLKDKVITHLQDDYDLILIDTPPTASVFNWTAIEAATGVIIPCTPQSPDKKSTDYYCHELSQIIKESPTNCENLSWYRFMATNHNASRDTEVFDRMRNDFGSKMLHSNIISAPCFNTASDNYRSVVDLFPDAKGNVAGAKRSVEDTCRDIRQILIEESNKHKDSK